ncbi:MAG: hypothetical protein ABUT11_02715 [Leifsonia sp.]
MTMSTPTRPERFDRFLEMLIAEAARHDDVVGVAAFGSTADRHRADEWSDHDIAWVVQPGAEVRYRDDLSWLPTTEPMAISVIEHHGGGKAIDERGHVVEFGVTTVDGLSQWFVNRYEVLLDRGGIREALEIAASRGGADGRTDDAREIRLALADLLIGVGRYRRGEVLSAGQSIRSDAVGHLLAVLGHRLPDTHSHLDSLDARRRFELVNPAIGASIERSLRHDPETCARELLDLAERLLPTWKEFPRSGAAAIRRRLGWET